MANLTGLREKIKNITDYSPELQQFNDQLGFQIGSFGANLQNNALQSLI